jgi:oligosaccharyltransferase complex subunit gamma
MRILLFPLLSLVSVVYAAERSAAHTKLISLAHTNGGVIKLDSSTYELITSADREWSATIQLTALSPTVQCVPCKTFDPNFRAVARAWSNAPPADRDDHFFASLDFQDGQDVFRKLGLTSAPVIYIYPAAKGHRRPANGKWKEFTHDFNSEGFDTEAFATAMSKHTPSPVPYKPPFDYERLINITAAVSLILLLLRFAGPVLTSKWTWAAVVIGASCVFNSGYMFVQIRGQPMTAKGPRGEVQWMASGFQNMYGMEYQVITMLYGFLAFAHVALFVLVPRVSGPAKQRTAVYLWTTVIFILFSILVAFFRAKNLGYPFKLFF